MDVFGFQRLIQVCYVGGNECSSRIRTGLHMRPEHITEENLIGTRLKFNVGTVRSKLKSKVLM